MRQFFLSPNFARRSQTSVSTGPDLSSFFDTSFDASIAFPTDSFGLPALSYSHAFARSQDALLSSPLGLSPLSGSPFDFSYDPNSPLLAFGSEDEGAPELCRNAQLPSLFYDGPAPNLVAQSPVWAPVELAQPASLERAEMSISPAMMRLDSFGAAEEVAVVAAPALAKKARKVTKRTSTSPALEDEEMTEQQAKDKFTGTRNTKIPPIDFTAPTMSRSVSFLLSSRPVLTFRLPTAPTSSPPSRRASVLPPPSPLSSRAPPRLASAAAPRRLSMMKWTKASTPPSSPMSSSARSSSSVARTRSRRAGVA